MGIALLNEVDVDTVGNSWSSDGSCKSLLIDAENFGMGTVRIEVQRYGGQWVVPKLSNGSPAEFTQNTFVKFDYAGIGLYIRASLISSSGAKKVNVYLS